MKKYWLLSLLVLAVSPLSAFSANTPCTLTGTGAIDTAAGTYPNCATTPQGYDVTIYKLGLCTADPIAAANADFSSCHLLLNGAGQYTHLATGTSVALPGAVLPPNGTYGYAVLVIENKIGVTNKQTFSTNMTGSGGASGTGLTCWTLAGTVDRSTPAPNLVDCGAAASAAPAITIDKLDDFNGSNGDPSSGGTFDAVASCSGGCNVTGGVISAKLATSSLVTAVLADWSNSITRIIAVEAFDAAHQVIINATTTNIDIGFNVTNASSNWITGGNVMRQFGTGPFSMVITAK